MHTIVVVGSINMDIVNRVARHPQPGETIHGVGTEYSPGGKGANQAVAASLAGGRVIMLGAVGTDAFGGELTETLRKYGVSTDSIDHKEGTSGLAFITVDAAGENSIILSSGANGKLSRDDIKRHLHIIEQADTILLQNEIPWETTLYTMEQATRIGKRVILNPAPALSIPADVMPLIDTIVLNESEAELVSGVPVHNVSDAEQAAERILTSGVRAVLVTLGDKGSMYKDEAGTTIHTPAFLVNPVDTTAAGDTFTGAYAVASRANLETHSISSIKDALRFASAAAALTVTREGAQNAIPRREEVERFLIDSSGN